MNIKEQDPDMMATPTAKSAGLAKELSEHACVSYLDDVQLSDRLLSGQIKNAALIACSDMGISLPYVCSAVNVQLFLFQNFGHSFSTGGFVETVVGSNVKNVIVYGHSICEHAKFLAESARDQPPVESPDAAERQHQLRLYSAALQSSSEKAWDEVCQYNVLLELKRLLADQVIGRLAERSQLKLHGWFYKSTTHQLEIFDPRKEAFVLPAHLVRTDSAVR